MSSQWISFEDFCAKQNIGKWNYYFAESKQVFEFKMEDFHKLVALELVLNGAEGGLVIGNSHQKGGIHMIRQKTETTFEYVLEMEG